MKDVVYSHPDLFLLHHVNKKLLDTCTIFEDFSRITKHVITAQVEVLIARGGVLT